MSEPTLEKLSITLREGSTIAVISGPVDALGDVEKLPLKEMKVCGKAPCKIALTAEVQAAKKVAEASLLLS